MEYFDTYTSPLGTLYIRFSDRKLTGVSFSKPRMKAAAAPDAFRAQLSGYFEGTLTQFTQEIKLLSGTPFEQRVWLALKEVPYSQTRTYKWLAEQIGNPRAMRAVGQALSKNPIPIVLPCHRIIESDGNLGGYASGTDIKRRLLQLEYYHSN